MVWVITPVVRAKWKAVQEFHTSLQTPFDQSATFVHTYTLTHVLHIVFRCLDFLGYKTIWRHFKETKILIKTDNYGILHVYFSDTLLPLFAHHFAPTGEGGAVVVAPPSGCAMMVRVPGEETNPSTIRSTVKWCWYFCMLRSQTATFLHNSLVCNK